MTAMKLKWGKQYKLGVPEVDSQHRRWFDLTNAFLDLARACQADSAVIEAALADAVDYTREHFANEEKLMRRVHFPSSEYVRHCKLHRTFTTRVERMSKQWLTGKSTEASEIGAFMSNWLVGHILSTDIKYIGFYLSSEAEREWPASRGRRKR